jgi:hypothetical protein
VAAMERAFAGLTLGACLLAGSACSRSMEEKPVPAVAADEASGAACGRSPLPKCPLQGWMDANLAESFNRGRLERLLMPLGALSFAAPPSYDAWAPFARAGVAAVGRGDHDGVRASCEGCHRAYRDRYRVEMRARPLQDALGNPS